MYTKKPFEKRYLIIIIIVVLALLLVVLSFALKKDRNLSFPERVIKDSGTFIVNVVSSPVNFIKNFFQESNDKKNIYDKYSKLKEKEAKLNSIIAERDSLKEEVDKLKKELDLKDTLNGKILKSATVINRNIEYWYDQFTINKGKKDGVERNMAVINSRGLIGKISKTSNHVSTIKLLANENMSDKVSVKIKANDKYVYGLISKYDTKTNSYTVEGISENIDIPEGADVVTTGMGDYPSGLLIGQVDSCTTDNFDLSKVAIVKSSVDFNDIDYVTIVKKETT